MYVCSYVSEKKLTFCNEIATHVAKEKIPAGLVINWDQTPLHYIPAINGPWRLREQARFLSLVAQTNGH